MANDNETAADIVAEIRRLANPLKDGIIAINGRQIADRLDAAHKREMDDLRKQRDLWSKRAAELVEKCNEQYAKLKQVGNAAKLREALSKFCAYSAVVLNTGMFNRVHLEALLNMAKAALAAPARNCDVGSAEEQAKRFYNFCTEHSSAIQVMCDYKCLCIDSGDKCYCLCKWMQMPYEEGGNYGQ